MILRVQLLIFFGFLLISPALRAQEDLLKLLGEDTTEVIRVTNSFKSTRVIASHSIEHVAGGVLDFRIMHRFGALNTGGMEFFGLDQATIRLGFDYGINDRLTVGIGRSSLYKEIDGFLKYKAIWQSEGARHIPVSLIIVAGTTVSMLKWSDPDRRNYFSSRMGYYYQAIVGRKFSDGFSAQMSPILVHRNLVATSEENHDVFATEIGGRLKLSQRVSVTADYFFIIPGQLPDENSNPLSVGLDIETGGHVFQLHVTNAPAMNEKTFITDTKGKWADGDIHIGFNISRVFTISKKNR